MIQTHAANADARIRELLRANNDLVERTRAAEKLLQRLVGSNDLTEIVDGLAAARRHLIDLAMRNQPLPEPEIAIRFMPVDEETAAQLVSIFEDIIGNVLGENESVSSLGELDSEEEKPRCHCGRCH